MSFGFPPLAIWSSARRFSAEFPLPFVYLCYTFGIGLVSFYQGSHELRRGPRKSMLFGVHCERVGRAEALGAFNSPASSVRLNCRTRTHPTLYIYTRGRQKLRFFADLLPFFRRLYKSVLIISRPSISYSAHQKSQFSPLSFNLSPVSEAVQSGLPKIC